MAPDLYRLATTGKNLIQQTAACQGAVAGVQGSSQLRMELNPGEPTNRWLETEQP